MPNLLMLASGVGLVAAAAALWVQGWRRDDHRFFAGLISIAVTLSLFSASPGRRPRSHLRLLPGFLSARSLFCSRYDCIERVAGAAAGPTFSSAACDRIDAAGQALVTAES